MNLLTIDIRRATLDDAEAVSDIHAASWQGAYCGIIPHKALLSMINRRNTLWWDRAIRRGTSVLVLEMGGTLCGYVTYGLNRARALPQDGEIYELYLLPEYQGIGLGKRLFNAARRSLADNGCNGLVVWSLEDNHGACDFYAHMGGCDHAQGSECFDGVTLNKIAFIWS